jgi:uncharacterized protein
MKMKMKMKKAILRIVLHILLMVIMISVYPQEKTLTDNNASYKFAKFSPCDLDEVKITGGFWDPIILRCIDTSLLDYYQKFEKAGYIDNFKYVKNNEFKSHNGGANNNEFVYKWMEAAAYYSPKSARIKNALDNLIELVISTQDEDGYINTFYDNPINKRKGLSHFSPQNRFEFYNFGHLLQAGIANFRVNKDRRLLDAAIRFADLIVENFSEPKHLPYKMNLGPSNLKREHPNHENAMVELYRITGDERYLNFVIQTLNEYDFWSQKEIDGHAVQESLLAQGAVDVYLETGDDNEQRINLALWEDMYYRKMYITGAIGSRHKAESFGSPYELPNYGAYAETCASITNIFWSYKMLLAEGDAKYSDCIERILYNGFLSGYGLSGTEYFYINPLAVYSKDEHINPYIKGGRQAFFDCSCCPPNIMRLLGSLQQYIYTKNSAGIQVQLFISSEITTTLDSGEKIEIIQQTEYPRKGEISLTIKTARDKDFSLFVRKPAWTEQFTISVNNQAVNYKQEHGYLEIKRNWSSEDIVNINFPMKPRLEVGNIKTENAGRVAICRGPIVYCIEASDNGKDVLNSAISLPNNLNETFQSEKLGGYMEIELERLCIPDHPEEPYYPYSEIDKLIISSKKLTAIPYFLWANREFGDMEVWIPIFNP